LLSQEIKNCDNLLIKLQLEGGEPKSIEFFWYEVSNDTKRHYGVVAKRDSHYDGEPWTEAFLVWLETRIDVLYFDEVVCGFEIYDSLPFEIKRRLEALRKEASGFATG